MKAKILINHIVFLCLTATLNAGPAEKIKTETEESSQFDHEITAEHINSCDKCAHDMHMLLKKENLKKLDFEKIGTRINRKDTPSIIQRAATPIAFAFTLLLIGGIVGIKIYKKN